MRNAKRLTSAVVLAGLAAAVILLALPNTASAQIKPAMVRNVDEPARVPYSYSLSGTCPYANVCAATFPVVPAGKRLRVTRIGVFWRDQTPDAFLVLDVNSMLNPVLIFPVSPAPFAYYGYTYSLSQEVDYYFEAGQSPILEIGSGGTFSTFYPPKFMVTGYIVDLLP